MKFPDRSDSFVSQPPAGVVFDLGNVLIAWDPRAAVAAGVGEAEAARFLGAEDFDFLAWNLHQDAGRSWAEAMAELRDTHPHWVSHAEAYLAHFTHSLADVPGTADVVRDLHAAGVPLFGLTNWSAELYPHASERFEVLAMMDDVVVSGEIRTAKPDPRAFQVVAERAGQPLDRLAFVDDSPRNVEAAAALGMDAILFTGADALRRALRERGLPV
jgi:2-haloacid dehalogenase